MKATKLKRNLSLTSRSEEHTSELQSLTNLVCRLLLEKKNPATLKALVTAHGDMHLVRGQHEHTLCGNRNTAIIIAGERVNGQVDVSNKRRMMGAVSSA